MIILIPEFMDEVRHKVTGFTGTVDANYTINGLNLLDVQINDEMYYGMIASNWEVITKYIP